MSDTSNAADHKVEVIEILEDVLKDFITEDGDRVSVERCYSLSGGYDDFEIVVTFPDGSYLSLDTPTALPGFGA